MARDITAKSNAMEIFEEEFQVAESAERILDDKRITKADLAEKYRFLLKKYRSLLKQAVKITGIGDATQSKLIRIQNELDRRNEELAKKNAALTEKNEALIRAQEALLQSQQRAKAIFSAYAEALPGTILDDKYRLDTKIGTGGFGAVFQATHLVLNRQVAVKVLQPRTGNVTPEDLERFRREGISACRIVHPNAVAILDFGISTTGIAYLVMELLQGVTLGQEIKRHRRLSPGRCGQLLAPVCEALAEAHTAGIIHRDIKPDNIFLHQSPSGEVVKVLDFGLAKLMDGSGNAEAAELTRGVIVGTPTYMPPERLSGLPYDGRADIYSLGVVLYEMLCGRPPFILQKNNLGALISAHMATPPPPPRLFQPDLPEEVERLAVRTLEKIPSDRPTARELADELAGWAERYPTTSVAPPPTDEQIQAARAETITVHSAPPTTHLNDAEKTA